MRKETSYQDDHHQKQTVLQHEPAVLRLQQLHHLFF